MATAAASFGAAPGSMKIRENINIAHSQMGMVIQRARPGDRRVMEGARVELAMREPPADRE